jgi:predicted nuclease of predicted toxin-antitoxin system
VTVRFLADEDLDADIVAGLRLREPAIDIMDVKNAGLRAAEDAALLDLAAQQHRILVSHDRHTMTRHFGIGWPPENRLRVCSSVHSGAQLAR